MNKCVALTRSWQAAEQKKSFWAAKYCKKSTFLAQINFAVGKICHRDLCLKVGAKSKNQFDAMPRRATNISRLKAYPSFLLQVFWYRYLILNDYWLCDIVLDRLSPHVIYPERRDIKHLQVGFLYVHQHNSQWSNKSSASSLTYRWHYVAGR